MDPGSTPGGGIELAALYSSGVCPRRSDGNELREGSVSGSSARWCPISAFDECSQALPGGAVAAHPVAVDAQGEAGVCVSDQLVSSTFEGFATWIGERAEWPIPNEDATAIAALGLGSLLSSRLLRDVLGIPAQVDDETLVDTWVELMVLALTRPAPTNPG